MNNILQNWIELNCVKLFIQKYANLGTETGLILACFGESSMFKSINGAHNSACNGGFQCCSNVDKIDSLIIYCMISFLIGKKWVKIGPECIKN